MKTPTMLSRVLTLAAFTTSLGAVADAGAWPRSSRSGDPGNALAHAPLSVGTCDAFIGHAFSACQMFCESLSCSDESLRDSRGCDRLKALFDRYAPTGASLPCLTQNLVDETFGDAGSRYLSYRDDGGYPWGVATDSQGRILILTDRAFDGATRYSLTRLLRDGTTDTSFGNAGWVTGSLPELPIDSNMRGGMTLDDNDNIYVTIQARIGGAPFYHEQFGVLKLRRDGSRDVTFGDDGLALHVLTGTENRIEGIVPLADGKVLAIGQARSDRTGSQSYAAVAMRLSADGSRDPTYGSDSPWQYTPWGLSGVIESSVTIVPDGSYMAVAYGVHKNADGIYLAGLSRAATNDCFVAKLDLDGELDTSFGVGGSANYSVYSYSNETCGPITSDAHGNVYPMGRANLKDGAGRVSLLFKTDSDGNLDPSYGQGGVVTYQIGGAGGLSGGVMMADGRFVGLQVNPETSLVVLDAAGWIDDTFDPIDNDPTFIRQQNGAYTRPMATWCGRDAFLHGGQVHLTMCTRVNGWVETVITRLASP